METARELQLTASTRKRPLPPQTCASNNSVNPDPGRAPGTLTCRTPCSGQRTRGSRACKNAFAERNPDAATSSPRRHAPDSTPAHSPWPGTRTGHHDQSPDTSQLGSLGIELAARHPPRPAQPQRRRDNPSSSIPHNVAQGHDGEYGRTYKTTPSEPRQGSVIAERVSEARRRWSPPGSHEWRTADSGPRRMPGTRALVET
jgi:hypothetical protein